MISGRIPHEIVGPARSVDPRGGISPPSVLESALRQVRVGTAAGLLPLLDQGGPYEALQMDRARGGRTCGCPRDHRHCCRREPASRRRRVHGDGARLGSAGGRARYRSEPRQRLGGVGGPDDALVGRQQRNRHLDALRRSRDALPAAAERAARRHGPGCADRHGLLRRRAVPRPERGGDGAREVHLRDRGRHDRRLASGHGSDGDGLRRFEVGRRLQGPRDRGRLALRDRLPQRPRGHHRR